MRYYNIDKDNEPLSRYKHLSRIEEDGFNYIETVNPLKIPKNSTDSYFKVTKKYENRLDLISYKFYNTVLLWWVIAKASNILDPLNVKEGTLLRIPSKTSIYGYKGVVR